MRGGPVISALILEQELVSVQEFAVLGKPSEELLDCESKIVLPPYRF